MKLWGAIQGHLIAGHPKPAAPLLAITEIRTEKLMLRKGPQGVDGLIVIAAAQGTSS